MNQKNRRKAIAIRSFTYGVMTLAVFLGVAFALSWAMGFRFDFKSGQISQVALMQFDSFPQGANVSVNGVLLSGQTPSRLNVDTGKKSIKISLKGYREWSAETDANPSAVVWMNYARLVPTNVRTSSVKTFADTSGAGMLASPDKNRILLWNPQNSRDFSLADISDPTKPKFKDLQIDSGKILPLAEAQIEKFIAVEWDLSSRYLLVQHDIFSPDGNLANSEFVEIDTQNNGWNGSNSRSLTKDFSVGLSAPHFSGNSGNVFFAMTGSDVRKLDYGNNSISSPLASNVIDYKLYGSNIFSYVSRNSDADGKVFQNVGIFNDGKVIDALKFDDDLPTKAVFSTDEGADYLAVSRKTDDGSKIMIYAQPLENANNFAKIKPSMINTLPDVNLLTSSPSGRLIVSANGQNMSVYDIETGRQYFYEMNSPQSNLIWLDSYHLLDNSQDAFYMVDFSGQNRQKITNGYGVASLSADGKFMFSLSDKKQDDGRSNTDFQSSAMTIN